VARDELHRDLVRWLRALRRQPGLLAAERLAVSAPLISFIGNGSPVLAWNNLMALRKRYGTDPESDVGAFFYLSGWKIGGDSLEWRRNHYARRFACDDRTALRRADRGAATLATLIREEVNYDRPCGNVITYQDGNTASLLAIYRVRTGETFPVPRLSMDGTRWRLDQLAESSDASMDGFVDRRLKVINIPLVRTREVSDPCVELGLVWTPSIWPYWELVGHCADPRLHWHFTVDRSGMLSVSLNWASEVFTTDSFDEFTFLDEVSMSDSNDGWFVIDMAA